MAVDRIAYFSGLVAEDPDEPRGRYGLAVALRHAERHAEAIDQYRAYLDLADDEGAAYGHLAECLAALTQPLTLPWASLACRDPAVIDPRTWRQ